MVLSEYCLAKYQISKKLNSNFKVAVPVLELETQEAIKITGINNIGNVDFTIKNYNENRVSDIALNYYIEIISNTDKTIEFKLYKGNEEINLKNNKTNTIFIDGKTKQEHIYKLEISYDKNKNTSEQDILEDVKIKVHSEQARG